LRRSRYSNTKPTITAGVFVGRSNGAVDRPTRLSPASARCFHFESHRRERPTRFAAAPTPRPSSSISRSASTRRSTSDSNSPTTTCLLARSEERCHGGTEERCPGGSPVGITGWGDRSVTLVVTGRILLGYRIQKGVLPVTVYDVIYQRRVRQARPPRRSPPPRPYPRRQPYP
jgi:hypothetical protein